jgi:5-methylcytosine-specific restriction enzyme A
MATRAPLHRPAAQQSDAERKRAHDRGKVRYYNSRRWHHLRNAYLASHPLCECGCMRPASVVDHRKPHKGDDALMYAWDNLQAMAKPCHDRKTATHDGGFGNRRAQR